MNTDLLRLVHITRLRCPTAGHCRAECEEGVLAPTSNLPDTQSERAAQFAGAAAYEY